MAARRARGETVVAPKPAFSEISIAIEETAPENVLKAQSRASLAIGDVEISFPAHISSARLSKLFEAVKSVK